MKNLWLLLTVFSMTACGQTRDLGKLPDTESGGLALVNLNGGATRTYSCRAGRVSPMDDGPCSCNQENFVCDAQAGGICTCDPTCVGQRPEIDCGDLSLTFVLENEADLPIERMTGFEVVGGAMELRWDGLDCNGSMWRVPAKAKGSVIGFNYEYDRDGGDPAYASPSGDLPCYDPGDPRDSGRSVQHDDTWLGEPQPPFPSGGALLVKVRGLLTDGTAWEVVDTTDL